MWVDSIFLYTCRPAGAKYTDVLFPFAHDVSFERAIVGWFPSPTGWETQPLRIHPPVIPYPPIFDNTLRSSGARGLDISPFYRHIAPLERKTVGSFVYLG